MIQEKDLPKIAAPTRKSIAKATVIAAAVAAFLLFAAVLPAEYGFDPLRTGAALGLTELSKAKATKPEPSTAPVEGQISSTTTYTAQPRIYKVDSEDLLLRPGQGVEIKYHPHAERRSDGLFMEGFGQTDVRVSWRAGSEAEP